MNAVTEASTSMADWDRPPSPLHFRVREYLLEMIRSGELAPGDQIPTEAELMSQFEVSRTTVRRALQDVQSGGFIRRRPGVGTFVALPVIDQTLRRVTGFVEDVEQYGLRASAKVLKVERIVAERSVAQALGLPTGRFVTYIERIRLANNQAISLDRSYLPEDVGNIVIREDLAQSPIYSILENVCELPLSQAEYVLEAMNAGDDVASNLNTSVNAAVMHIARTTFDHSDRALMHEHLYYRGDRIRYRLTLPR